MPELWSKLVILDFNGQLAFVRAPIPVFKLLFLINLLQKCGDAHARCTELCDVSAGLDFMGVAHGLGM